MTAVSGKVSSCISGGTNSDAIQATWEYLYKVIVLSNQSLEILGELRQKTDYNDLDRYEAEVRAFRAMYYYYLVDMFGRVPLIVSSSIPVKDVRQSDRKEVFDFCCKRITRIPFVIEYGA